MKKEMERKKSKGILVASILKVLLSLFALLLTGLLSVALLSAPRSSSLLRFLVIILNLFILFYGFNGYRLTKLKESDRAKSLKLDTISFFLSPLLCLALWIMSLGNKSALPSFCPIYIFFIFPISFIAFLIYLTRSNVKDQFRQL